MRPVTIRHFSLYLCVTVISACSSTSVVNLHIEQDVAHRSGLSECDKISNCTITIAQDKPLRYADVAGIALWNNPKFRADLRTLEISEADIVEAGILRNPNFFLLFPRGAKPFEFFLTLPAEALWQRNRRVAAAERAYQQVGENLVQNGLDIIRDARLAFIDLVLVKRRLKLTLESLTLRRQIATITQARLRLGDISPVEQVTAASEVGIAQQQEIQLRHDILIARERLLNVLGFSIIRPELNVSLELTLPDSVDDFEKLVSKALVNRPDLRAAELGIEAATSKASWERSRMVQLVSLLLSTKEVGNNGVLTGPGVTADIPIFNHNQGLIARADAETQVAIKRYLEIKNRVAFEVAEARQQLLQAQELLAANTGGVLAPLLNGIAGTKAQYERGEISYLTVLEQSRMLIDSQLRGIDYETAALKAAVQLERSVGGK